MVLFRCNRKLQLSKSRKVCPEIARSIYLGIAFSKDRLINVNKQTLSFSYIDYKEGGSKKLMTLSHGEFIRRFAMHNLLMRFVWIRHYGILSSTWKRKKLPALQEGLSGIPTELVAKTTVSRWLTLTTKQMSPRFAQT